MKFFNKKEQVIDLEVTPYGKSLLARGRFKPEFYAFYDSGVIYDSQYGGVLEHQNSASARIKEIPQLETQAYFYGAESQVKLATEFHRLTQKEKSELAHSNMDMVDLLKPYISDDAVTIATIPDREFYGIPIGSSELNSSFAPSWDATVLRGEISSSTATLPDWGNVQSIPQLNMEEILYNFKISDFEESSFLYGFTEENGELDGKFLNIIEDSIILEVDEKNSTFDFENFDIEVFSVESVSYTGSSGGTYKKELLKPLFFKKETSLVQNGILLEPYEVEEKDVTVNPNYVEYYFDLLVDKEIDEGELCEAKPADKAQGIFSERMLDCGELEDQEDLDIEGLYDGDNFVDECD